jgi:hypothetical protein
MNNTIFEEIRVSGDELLKRVKSLIRKGNIRKMIIRNNKGETLLETTLTYGATGIGSLIILAPFISAVTFMALMLSEATIVVEREPNHDDKEIQVDSIEIVED